MSTINMKTCALVLAGAAVVASLTVMVDTWGKQQLSAGYNAGLKAGEEVWFKKGKEAKTLELAKVFAPYGYEKIKAAKMNCEVKSGMTCRIYGGFAPETLPKKDPDVTKKGPM